jgi:hypothetical protein
MAIKREKIIVVNFILILIQCLIDKSATQKWQICYSLKYIFANPTVSFNAFCSSCAKITCCSSEFIFTFLYAGSSIQNANELFVSYIHLSFLNFSVRPTRQAKISENWFRRLKRLYLGILPKLDTCSYELFFLTIASKYYLSSWITLYRHTRAVYCNNYTKLHERKFRVSNA